MRKIRFAFPCLLIASLPLCACMELTEGGDKAATNVRKSMSSTEKSLRRLFSPYPPGPDPIKPVPPSYCYRVMQDILCYPEAQPGAEGRLVAYQGSVTEEVNAPVATVSKVETQPPPVTMAPSPPQPMHEAAPVVLKPQTIGAPPAVKAVKP